MEMEQMAPKMKKPPVNLTDGYTGATGVGYVLVKI
jgi:hypothetical protein